MVQSITVGQAVGIYQGEVQRQISLMTPVQRSVKMFGPIVKGRQVPLSMTDILRELQNGSAIGQQLAIDWCQQQTDGDGNFLYIVKL
jgi:hypothetical protein